MGEYKAIQFQDNADRNYQYIAENELIEIDPERIQRFEPIASGHFGQVHFGLLDGTIEVAIKTVKTTHEKSSEKEQRESMREELKIFAEIGGHENVVKLLGAVTTNDLEFCIVLEYCTHKGLNTFLNKRKENFIDEIVQERTIFITQYKSEIESGWAGKYLKRRLLDMVTTSDLLAFALQVSRGLEFLHHKKILHRDLALRNILLTKYFVVKIADFGLSRLTEDDNYVNHKKNPKLPFKWLPIEALSTGSTPLKSDLWTFGILLWELFTLNGEPYAKIEPRQYEAFIESGKRLDKPPLAPMEIYFYFL